MSSIDELKVVSVVHGSLSSLCAVLIDANNFPNWIYACAEAKIVQQVSEKEQYQYQRQYELVPLDSNNIRVTYTLALDPGGDIPDWLINMTIVTGPYESTLKLQKEVYRPEYRNKKLSFIQEAW